MGGTAELGLVKTIRFLRSLKHVEHVSTSQISHYSHSYHTLLIQNFYPIFLHDLQGTLTSIASSDCHLSYSNVLNNKP